MRKCVRLYDEGTLHLAEALDIQYDRAVNALLMRAARDLAKCQAQLLWLDQRRRIQQRKEEQAKEPTPEAKPETRPEPVPEAKPAPEPVRPPTRPNFVPATPPALPTDAAPSQPADAPKFLDDGWLRREKKGIETCIKEYFDARRKGKLRNRCKLCAAKGTNRDGTVCEMCRGAGHTINLHYFRKAYWNGFTPIFRDSEGSLEALRAYLDHARTDPASLGPVVRAYKLTGIEPHGSWAHVTVALKTDAGESEERITLIRIGSTWFFFNPATDEDLLVAD
jgi:hypothetical protein